VSGYVPKVGDKVTCESWRNRGIHATDYVIVTAVGTRYFLGEWPDRGGEDKFALMAADDWEPYVEPVVYPERWINVYVDGLGAWGVSRAECDHYGDLTERIGVLHLLPDGSTAMEAP
jgi:hypothetical protein